MPQPDVSDRRPFDTLHALLATARELVRTLADDAQLERLVCAFRMFPERDREPILQLIEKDAAWRGIVESTEGATGIAVTPNPHASLYLHVLEVGAPPLDPDASRRDADVIRQGVRTFVQLLPLLFQDAVHAQWTAAARDVARTSTSELRELAVRLAHEVQLLVGEAESDGTTAARR